MESVANHFQLSSVSISCISLSVSWHWGRSPYISVASTAQMPATNNCLCIFTLSSLATNICVSYCGCYLGSGPHGAKKRKNKEKN